MTRQEFVEILSSCSSGSFMLRQKKYWWSFTLDESNARIYYDPQDESKSCRVVIESEDMGVYCEIMEEALNSPLIGDITLEDLLSEISDMQIIVCA